MNLSSTILIFSSALNILVAGFVLRAKRKNIVNQTFALFATLVGLWVAFTLLLKLYPGLFTGSATVSLGFGIGIAFFLLARVYPSSKTKPTLKFYAPFLVFLAMVLIGGPARWIIKEVTITEGVGRPTFGFLYIPIMIYPSSLGLYAIYRLVMTYIKSRSADRLRMTFLIAALLGFMLTTFLVNGLFPSIGIYSLIDLGPALSVVWIGIISIAILKQRLFGVRVVVGRGLYLALLVLIPYIAFLGLFSLQLRFLGDIYSPKSLTSGLFLSTILLFLLFKLNKTLKKAIDYLIINTKFDPEAERTKLSKKLNITLTKDEISKAVRQTLQNTLEPKRLQIEFYEKNESGKRPESSDKVFIKSGEKVLGHILIAPEANSPAYTAQDYEFIESLIPSIAAAIKRALLHQKVQDFNEELKEKIRIATKDLEQKVKQLKLAREREQEILDIMGHEIRTPAAVAKLSVEFVLAELKKGTISEAKVNKLLTSSLSGIDQQYNLAQTYITAAKLSKNTFSVNTEPTELGSLVSKCAEQFKLKAKENNLKIKISRPKKRTLVNADQQAIKQVLFNLLDNAIKYTKKGAITISFSQDKKHSYFSIKDTGKGIPKESLMNLGNKFYRIKTDKTLSGTGLGLYVVQGIVKAHKGKFKIESKKNKGTKFTVGLPKC